MTVVEVMVWLAVGIGGTVAALMILAICLFHVERKADREYGKRDKRRAF